jgi:hypothetical protein
MRGHRRKVSPDLVTNCRDAAERLPSDAGRHSSRARCSLAKVRRAMAAGAWSGIAKTELTLISHKT